jgi:5'-3' exonuclease
MPTNAATEPRMVPVFVLKPKENTGSYVNYLVLDWSNVVHRAVAVAGKEKFIELLVSMLVNYRRRFHKWKFCFTLDSPGGVEARKVLLPAYKHNRATRPQEDQDRYRSCMETSLLLLDHLDGLVAQCPQGEADDVIASFIRQSKRGRRFVIVSEDRDLWQLIQPHVTVWTRQNNEITMERCVTNLGTLPNRVPMLKALLGDTSDCIPRGIAKVKRDLLVRVATALKTPGGIEPVLQLADWLRPLDQQQLREGWAQVLRNYSIIKLRDNLPLVIQPKRASTSDTLRFLERQHTGLLRQELDLLVGQG